MSEQPKWEPRPLTLANSFEAKMSSSFGGPLSRIGRTGFENHALPRGGASRQGSLDQGPLGQRTVFLQGERTEL
ncbi:hypothetical protein ACFL0Y_04270 [Patescibacteria group bacterium]